MFEILDRSSVLTGLAALVFVVFSLFPGMAGALEENRYSETEKVGFAFYRLARTDPDFKSWIESTDRYQKAFPIDRSDMLRNDSYRLQKGFLSYMPDIDLISLAFQARVEASKYFGESQREGATTRVAIDFEDLPENYFPFPVGDIWIALVVKDWDRIVNMSMDREEYGEFARAMKFDKFSNTKARDVNIDLKLRPLSVDISAPLTLDGLDMWLMLVEIGDIMMWRDNYGRREYLWSYTAPWYVSNEQKELLQLYGK